MLNALAELLKVVWAPESDWGKFSRKVLGLIISAAIGATIWNVYFNYQQATKGELPVGEVIERNPTKRDVIKRLLERISNSDRNIESVWLYSWPDATSLIPVMYVGDSLNPMPLGSFRAGDELPVGTFVLEGCSEIDRRANNFSCAINGFEDAWGVLVVVYPEDYEPTERQTQGIKATARIMGIVLYSNESHNGSID